MSLKRTQAITQAIFGSDLDGTMTVLLKNCGYLQLIQPNASIEYSIEYSVYRFEFCSLYDFFNYLLPYFIGIFALLWTRTHRRRFTFEYFILREEIRKTQSIFRRIRIQLLN